MGRIEFENARAVAEAHRRGREEGIAIGAQDLLQAKAHGFDEGRSAKCSTHRDEFFAGVLLGLVGGGIAAGFAVFALLVH